MGQTGECTPVWPRRKGRAPTAPKRAALRAAPLRTRQLLVPVVPHRIEGF